MVLLHERVILYPTQELTSQQAITSVQVKSSGLRMTLYTTIHSTKQIGPTVQFYPQVAYLRLRDIK